MLPVHTKARASPGSPTSLAGSGRSNKGRASHSRAGQRCRSVGVAWRAAAALLMLLALTAFLAGAAVSCYILTTIYESPAAVAAAAAEAQAAAAAASASHQLEMGAATPSRPSEGAQAPLLAPNHTAGQQLAASGPTSQLLDPTRYTVVVMSYRRRLRTLPLVINKLGSCPSGEARQPGPFFSSGWAAQLSGPVEAGEVGGSGGLWNHHHYI